MQNNIVKKEKASDLSLAFLFIDIELMRFGKGRGKTIILESTWQKCEK